MNIDNDDDAPAEGDETTSDRAPPPENWPTELKASPVSMSADVIARGRIADVKDMAWRKVRDPNAPITINREREATDGCCYSARTSDRDEWTALGLHHLCEGRITNVFVTVKYDPRTGLIERKFEAIPKGNLTPRYLMWEKDRQHSFYGPNANTLHDRFKMPGPGAALWRFAR